MDETDFLATRFEQHRGHLRAVAYRMLGSLAEADDAVQEAWLRLSRTDSSEIENLGGWLTTVVGRVCLNMLRSRQQRREEPLDPYVPDPVVERPDDVDPEHEAVLADSVGLALLVVLETLSPAERLAFVLHDLFAMPFDEIAPIIGRTEVATRKLASRARRRVQGTAPEPEGDLARRREIVDAFLAAARGGDLDALVAVLDPDVVVRTDGGRLRPSVVLRGPQEVARGATAFARIAEHTVPALVNGEPGAVAMADGKPISVAAFTVVGDRIVALDVLADPERIARLDLSALR
ncbi:RNA polymerase sigma factor SigJ [Prauserella muralis]|uniref:RNA polymerase subunit sigma-70 n=1 Tax=Prauserella muralis TaxID=588067 RepID=A0A2V4APZ4_9PSEU|nr:RNA polymerase sigma factor SigJ [Prauserella muralis]PXY22672.1 RNA polymerase subunit sigma-70 [Prauserella muralis]TWE28384.1 RNA polymerase sigma-70 factor (ECF subfamily) [Prauserella muralis]